MRFFILLVALACAAFPAFAHDGFFVLPKQNTLDSLLNPAPEKILTAPQKAEEYLQLYYQNCSAQNHPMLEEEQIKNLCACSIAGIAERYDVPAILTMFETSPAAQKTRDDAMRTAYRPCMAAPLKQTLLETCMNDRVLKWKLQNRDAVCLCHAQGVQAHFIRNSEDFTDIYVRYNKHKYIDPLAWYLASRGYKNQSKRWFHTCVKWHDR